MKLKFDINNKTHPDPFIFEDGDKLYIYSTHSKGVQAFSADDLFGTWHYEGFVAQIEGCVEYWAPSVIKHGGKYYMYVSFTKGAEFEHMHVLSANSPLGPFIDPIKLYNRFTIDSHVVKTDEGLFIWYAENNVSPKRIGTRVYVDKLVDPTTPANICREMIVPTTDKEIYTPQWRPDNNWHTVEGAFWFKEGDWQYVMYSGGCYQDDTYHVGYAAVKSDENDLTKLNLVKHPENGAFSPVIIRNEFEEGTGHNSVIKYRGEYYAIYHARDYGLCGAKEARTARICKLNVKDGIITAERYEDHI